MHRLHNISNYIRVCTWAWKHVCYAMRGFCAKSVVDMRSLRQLLLLMSLLLQSLTWPISAALICCSFEVISPLLYLDGRSGDPLLPSSASLPPSFILSSSHSISRRRRRRRLPVPAWSLMSCDQNQRRRILYLHGFPALYTSSLAEWWLVLLLVNLRLNILCYCLVCCLWSRCLLFCWAITGSSKPSRQCCSLEKENNSYRNQWFSFRFVTIKTFWEVPIVLWIECKLYQRETNRKRQAEIEKLTHKQGNRQAETDRATDTEIRVWYSPAVVNSSSPRPYIRLLNFHSPYIGLRYSMHFNDVHESTFCWSLYMYSCIYYIQLQLFLQFDHNDSAAVA